MKSVVYLISYIPIHALGMFEKLSAKFDHFTMVLSKPVQAGRPWKENFGILNVVIQKTISIKQSKLKVETGWELPTVVFPLSTVHDLSKLKPRVIISLELGFRTLAAWWYRRGRKDCRLIAHVRVTKECEAKRGLSRLVLRKFLLKRLDHIIVNGRNGASYLKSIGAPENKMTIITCGTDLKYFGQKQSQIRRAAQLRILYVGQLIAKKHIVPFLKILYSELDRRHTLAEITIAGWGPQKQHVIDMDRPSNVALTMLNYVEYDKLLEVYAQADVFVMPTLADEWGMVVNEALVSGVPVLGSDRCQAVTELIEDNVHGWIFDPYIENSIRDAINRMLDTPDEKLREMGRNARIRANFCSDEKEAMEIAQVVNRIMTS
jgi:glycosyltransferase involved in cell wall biosynthesis